MNTIQGLYAITHHDDQDLPVLLEDCKAALSGGAKLLQFRDKSSNSREKLIRAKALRKMCEHYQVPLIINDDIELCLKAKAHGVHLGLDDSSIQDARKILGESAFIGATCHNDLNRAQQAQSARASYIALGRFFPSKSKPDAKHADIECIQTIKEHCSLPIVAIGGITLDNANSLIQQGADSIAVIDGLFSSEDIKQQAQAFNGLFV